MALTPADLDAWDVAAIDQVSAAATVRAREAENGAAGVVQALMIGWRGPAAAVAHDSAQLIERTLYVHAQNCRRVAVAAGRASATIAELKHRLGQLRAEAHDAFLEIDSTTGMLVRAGGVLTPAQLGWQEAVMAELPWRIRQLLGDADSTDRELAAGIAPDDSGAIVPVPPRPADPPPDSAQPAEVKDWWDGLTARQRADYLRDQPEALDRDGIPVAVRDAANRNRLPNEIAAAEAELDAASRNHAGRPGSLNTALLANAASRYRDLLAIRSALGNGERTLILLDTRSDRRHVLGAIGIGDVDHAAHVGVTTGGVGTNADGLPAMAEEATNLRHTTSAILRKAGDCNPDSVATIAWVGYVPPADLGDIRVLGDGVANAAAGRLGGFFRGLAATAENPCQRITAFGHSYGSLVTSLALQQGSPVHNVVFYGSPGLELDRVADLRLAPGGHAYYEQAPGDPIELVQRVPTLLGTVGLVGPTLNWLLGSGEHGQRFGNTPNQVPGITQLSTAAGPDPLRIDDHRAAAGGHSEYARDDGTGELRMSGYNLAAVLSGVPGAARTGR